MVLTMKRRIAFFFIATVLAGCSIPEFLGVPENEARGIFTAETEQEKKPCFVNAGRFADRINILVNEFDAEMAMDVLVVQSIYDWCWEHDVFEPSRYRQGKVLRNTKTQEYLVLINEIIDPCSWSTGWPHSYLDSDWKIVRHLVLHELAHIVNNSSDEQECDDWAVDYAKFLDAKTEDI